MGRVIRALLISAVFAVSMGSAFVGEAGSANCHVCSAEAAGAKFTVTFTSGQTRIYACPRCALSTINLKEVASAQATDFFSRRSINAEAASYLVGSEVNACCGTSWLVFSSRKAAEKFALGFGGKVLTYDEALKLANPAAH